MEATITSKGQITIPKALREKYHLRTGDVIDFDENAPVLTGRKGISSEAFQFARSLRKEENPFEGMSIQWSPFTQASSFLAGKIQLAYRTNKAPRKYMIPDFLVAAHASLQADRLASTDRGFLRSYFSNLVLLAPK